MENRRSNFEYEDLLALLSPVPKQPAMPRNNIDRVSAVTAVDCQEFGAYAICAVLQVCFPNMTRFVSFQNGDGHGRDHFARMDEGMQNTCSSVQCRFGKDEGIEADASVEFNFEHVSSLARHKLHFCQTPTLCRNPGISQIYVLRPFGIERRSIYHAQQGER